MKFEQSETLQCLINAFAGESQARNRYTIYAKTAKKEGYEYISQIFLDTAENEREHAKLFYKHISNSEHWKVIAEYPFFHGNTAENLVAAANGEREEWEFIYIGADIDSYAEGASIGIRTSNIANYMKDNNGIDKMFSAVFSGCKSYSEDECISNDWKEGLE